MTKSHFGLLLFAALLACAALPAGASSSPPSAPDLARRIDAFQAPFDAANRLSGVLLIAHGDSILFHRAYGMAHVGLGVLNRTDTRIGIASVTKILTSIVLSQLLQEGVMAYDAPIERWLPDFPRGDEITVEHLARHRSGLPHRVTTAAEESLPLTAQDIVDRARRAPLSFEPGTASSYSSAGYTVLVRCMELAADTSFAALLQERIFDRAGMHDTVEPLPGREIANLAQNYVPGRGELWPAPLRGLTYLSGAGSLVSTAEDLWRFVRTLRTDALLITLDMLAREGRIRWTGASNGCYAYVDVHPEQDLTCIWLGNTWCGAADALRNALPALLEGDVVPPAARPPLAGTPSAEALVDYTGAYETRPGAWNTVRILGGELWVSDSMVLAIGPDRFWHQPWHCEVAFVRDEQGAVIAMERRSGDEVSTWPRRAGATD